MTAPTPFAYVDGRLATGLIDVTGDPSALDGDGFWVVVATFEGALTCARFAEVSPAPHPAMPAAGWAAPRRASWRSSMDRDGYRTAVAAVRDRIADGSVYQVNVCRILTSDDRVPEDPAALGALLHERHPAPMSATVHLPDHGIAVVSASPEVFLDRSGGTLTSRPIKGTAAPGSDFLPKDRAENVMIVDLVRNDLGAVARTGSVHVPELCVREEHPGLSHLVSTVTADLADERGWADILGAAFPPGSVSGAPKRAALSVIADLEPVPRGPYCGAIGWVDATRREARLAVGIRTFWWDRGRLSFGTGAGITWASDPDQEWEETELKARRLLATVSR